MRAGDVGSACGRSAECPGGLCFPGALGWPAGYCTIDGCTDDLDCGATGICVTDGFNTFCLQQCLGRTDCRTGYTCVPLTTASVCLPSCNADPSLVCAPTQCNTVTERCVGTCRSNADCSAGSTCRSGRCACTASTNCGANRRCNTASGVCGCANDAACGADGVCNVGTGECTIN